MEGMQIVVAARADAAQLRFQLLRRAQLHRLNSIPS
jgi:hypothetical protein